MKIHTFIFGKEKLNRSMFINRSILTFISLIASALGAMVSIGQSIGGGGSSQITFGIMVLLAFSLLIFLVRLFAMRLRDVGLSALLSLLACIPYIGFFLFVYLAIAPSKKINTTPSRETPVLTQ
jgi:uncharacterized membrane protein YhaH (DUF805 family)